MSWLSKGLKAIGKGLKKTASVVNPVAGIGYDLLGGRSVKDSISRAGDNFHTGQQIGLQLLPLALTGGVSGLGSLGSLGGLAGIGGGAAGAAGSGAGALGGLGKIGSTLLDNADLIQSGLGLIGAHEAGRKADRKRTQALTAAEQRAAFGLPLREQGRAAMLDQTPIDLSSVFAPTRTTNPFARRDA